MKHPVKQTAVMTHIMEDIQSGRYADGSRMPTEAEYSELFRVSRQTVRKALAALEAQGVIRRVQGSGSYVNHPSQRRRKTGQIAVICTYISEYIFPSILRGIEQVTKENDYQLLMNSTNNSIASERAILSKLRDNPPWKARKPRCRIRTGNSIIRWQRTECRSFSSTATTRTLSAIT